MPEETQNTEADSTENYVANFYASYKLSYEEINSCTRHCVAWRTADQSSGRPQLIGGGWPPAQDIYRARDSLNYRISSLSWHMKTLYDTQSIEAQKISESEINRVTDPNISNHALMRIGYVFDNIVFNSVSAFDYLAKYICRVHFPAVRGSQLEWRKLRLKNALLKLEDKQLSGLIEQIDLEWFRPLDRLRGDIIHDGAEIGDMQFSEQYNSDRITHTFEFNMPKKATELLPIFEDNTTIAVEPGAAMIMLQTLQYTRQIIKQMSEFKYRNLHDPLQTNRMKEIPPL